MHLHYIFPLQGRSYKLILHCRENFQPFQPIYYCTEIDIHFSMFSRWPQFSRGLPWGHFLYFSISFSWLTFLLNRKKTTQILVFLNIHFGILTWNMGYLLCPCTIFSCWPQIVNFISPNYARSSVFVQIKSVGSLAVWLAWAYFLCFSISFSSLTFLLNRKKTTQILVFLNIHFGILTWNMGHLLCLCTIFAYWPQIVNFIRPNYAQLSVTSLAVWLPWAYFLCFSISFSLLTFVLPNFATYALGPMSECLYRNLSAWFDLNCFYFTKSHVSIKIGQSY